MGLCKADSAGWIHDRRYSKLVATALDDAFSVVGSYYATQSRLVPLYDRLDLLAKRGMCRAQRARLLLLLGMACLARGDEQIPEAIHWLGTATDLADAGDDVSVLPLLFYYQGVAESWRLAFRSAISDFQACLGALHRLKTEYSQIDTSLEQSAYLRLATAEFYQAHYEGALDAFVEAEGLARLAPERPIELAMVQWGRALLLRWQRRPHVGLAHALAAWGTLRTAGDRSADGRLQCVIAELALDLASSFSAQHQQQRAIHFTEFALEFATRAIDLTRAAGDVPAPIWHSWPMRGARPL